MIGKREMQKITITEKEAIKLLNESYIVDYEGNTDRHRINLEKFLISTLEEIQQYREIGTVEEIKDLLVTISEASEDVDESGISVGLIKDLIRLGKYREIGTVEECREAVEKQKPKKIIRIVGRYPYKCPTCNGKLEIGYRHCIICGQLLRYPYENLEEMEDE